MAENVINTEDDENCLYYFVLRFWSALLKLPNSDQIINEKLFKKSLLILRKGCNQINYQAVDSLTERDLANLLNIIEFCGRFNFSLDVI